MFVPPIQVFLAIVLCTTTIVIIDAQEIQQPITNTNDLVHGFTIPPPSIKGIPLTFETIFSGTDAEPKSASASAASAVVGRSSAIPAAAAPSSFTVANQQQQQQSNVDIYALAASMLEAESNKLESAKVDSAQFPAAPPAVPVPAPPPPPPQPIVPVAQQPPPAVPVVHQASPTFQAVPVAPAQPTFQAVPVAHAQPTFQAVPVVQARPSIPAAPARPTFQAVPVAPAQPTFQAVPVAPARPTFQAVPVVQARPSIPVAPARPTFQAVPVAPARPAIQTVPIVPVVPRQDRRIIQRFQLPQTQQQFATKGSRQSRHQFIGNNPQSFTGRSSTIAGPPLIAHQQRLLTRQAPIQAPQGIIPSHYTTQVINADFLNPRPFSEQALVAIQQPFVSSAPQPVAPVPFIVQQQPTAVVAAQPPRQHQTLSFSNHRQSPALPGTQIFNHQVPLVNQGYPSNLRLIAAPIQAVSTAQFGSIPGFQGTLQHSADQCCTFFIQNK